MASTIEDVKAGVWTIEEWKERFCKDEWTTKEPDRNLVKLAERLFEGKDNKKVYFPCCGNSYDMKWAYDLGYEVVGTDCVPGALKDFFDNQVKLPYKEEKLDSLEGTLFKSEDNKIRLYCCDVLQFNGSIEGQCGAIVDSASITSMNKQDLPKYVEHLISMMTPNCRLILFTTEYDEGVYPGPPHSISESVVRDLFGEGFSYESLFTYDMMQMDEFQDWKEETLQQEDKEDKSREQDSGHHDNSCQDKGQGQADETQTMKAQKEEVFNQMMNLKTMLGRYTLITKK